MKWLRWLFLSSVLIITNLVLLLNSSGTVQALMLKMSLEQMAVGADTIVVGTVVEQSSQWNVEHTRIYTSVVLVVEETIKGVPQSDNVTIIVPGGEVGGITEWVSDTPRFTLGEKAVVFLKQGPGTRFEIYGYFQGKLTVERGKVSGVPLDEFKGQLNRAIRGLPPVPRGEMKQPAGPLFPDIANQPGLTATPKATASIHTPGWQTIMSDTFEDTFPGVWSVSGNASSGNVTWGRIRYYYHTGEYSVWCAGSSRNPNTDSYADNMSAWMVYGPFTLGDANAAELNFARWVRTDYETWADYFFVGISTNITEGFWGYTLRGLYPEWNYDTFDLRNWAHYGDLCGQPTVWLAFAFVSDASVTERGVFLDDISLRKYVGPAPHISSITPSQASAGSSTRVTITGSNFGTTPGWVNFFYQAGGPNISGDIISWSDTSIVAAVPTGIINGYLASASSGPVFVRSFEGVDSPPFPFTVTFSYGGYKWPGTSPVVNYRFNPTTTDCAGAELALQSAAATWTAVSGKNFAVNYAGTTTTTHPGINGANEITWNNLGWGILAQTIGWGSGDTITEVDIAFNNNYTWSTDTTTPAGKFDVQTVALHELGHWLNLRDLYGNVTGFPQDTTKAMFGYGSAAEIKRTLHADDQAGIRWIYPAAGTAPGVTTESAISVNVSSATLRGTLTSKGAAENVTVCFEWGVQTGNYTAATSPTSVSAAGTFSGNLTGLLPGTTYYYRARATGNGTTCGAEQVFTTKVTPPPFRLNVPSRPTFYRPDDVAVAPDGSMWVVQAEYNELVKFSPGNSGVELRIGTAAGGRQYRPWGVAFDPAGFVYVTDCRGHLIQKFTTDGTLVAEWGTLGSGDGQFNSPYGVAVDSVGNVYVADSGNHRIQKFTSTGTFLTKWGVLGQGDGQLCEPHGVAVDTAGNVYVADTGNQGISWNPRIQKFTSSGTFLTKWGGVNMPYGVAVDAAGNVYVADTYNSQIQKFTSSGTFLTKWGSTGSGDGQFNYIYGVAVDSAGNVYGFDWRCVQKFTSTGTFLARWGTVGTADGQLDTVQGLAVDTAGNVYLADPSLYRNHHIQKFTSTGTFITKWDSAGRGPFDSPHGVAVDPAGNVYVADTGDNCIQKFSSAGTFITRWGTAGSGNGQFNQPYRVAVDTSGNVYVADTGNNRIQKFTSTGTFLTKWGSAGDGDGQFNQPRGVAVDTSGNVYVADMNNNRIQKFTSTGTFLTKWGIPSLDVIDGSFREPCGVAVDTSGNVYVADSRNHRIQKFTSTGTFISKWGYHAAHSGPAADGQLNYPCGVAVDTAGNVYVADTDNDRIQKFTSTGTFINIWGQGSWESRFYYPGGVGIDSAGNIYVADSWNSRIMKFTGSGTFITKWGVPGSGDGEFNNPCGVVTDSAGNVYVADTNNNRIQKFTSTGTFITKWGSAGSGDGQFNQPRGIAVDSADIIYVADPSNNRIQKFTSSGTFLAKWGSPGNGDSQFNSPQGVAVDSAGNVYVADTNNHRIQKFTSTGAFLTKWGSQGYGSGVADGQFNYPCGVAVDPGGSVYVADTNNHRIQKFSGTGTFITKWGSEGTPDGQFSGPGGVAVDTAGNVYVADSGNGRIQKFTSTGTFITKWNSTGVGIGVNAPQGVAVDRAGNIYIADATSYQILKYNALGDFVTRWGSWGSGSGQFHTIAGIAVDAAGNVYVTDSYLGIQKFTSSGAFVTRWRSGIAAGGVAIDAAGYVYVADWSGACVWKFSSTGTFLRKWGFGIHPHGVAVDASGNVFVTECFFDVVGKFTSTGELITIWGFTGGGDGQFYCPYGVAIDTAGNVYIADYMNHRIQQFTGTGTFLGKWGSGGDGDGRFRGPKAVAVDAGNNVYVADEGNNRIQVFGTRVLTPPVVTTDNATGIAAGSAILNGTLSARGTADNVTISFEWGLTADNYTGTTSPASTNATGSFSFTLGGLCDNTTYHYRAKAVGHGIGYGLDKTFTTLPGTPPSVTTDNATSITSAFATLNGTLTSRGTADNVTVSFEWGLTADNYTGTTSPASTNATGPFSFTLGGLCDNTTYHYRAKAIGHGTSYGLDKTFTTTLASPGDANGDGKVDALDITKVERVIAGLDAPTRGADANQDGNINALDITRVERIIAEM